MTTEQPQRDPTTPADPAGADWNESDAYCICPAAGGRASTNPGCPVHPLPEVTMTTARCPNPECGATVGFDVELVPCPTCKRPGCSVCTGWTKFELTVPSAPPASEAGHREDSDEARFDALRRAWQIRGSLVNMEMIELCELTDRAFARLRQLRAEGERLREGGVILPGQSGDLGDWGPITLERCVQCPACAFTFAAYHTDGAAGGYSCPACGEQRAREEAAREAVLATLRQARLGLYATSLNPEVTVPGFADEIMAELGYRSQPPGAAQPQEGV
jgi:hypothetical protein